jgi:hypothetical protein
MEPTGGRTLLHDQFINFLEATVIALTLANAFAVIVAATAISMARDQRDPGLKTRRLAQPLRLLVSRRGARLPRT